MIVIGAGEVDTGIVTVIGMARALKQRVVAERVKTLEELGLLRAHQCDEAQRVYFGRSLPPALFAELLRTGIPEMISRPTAPSSNPERSGSCMPGGASRQPPETLLGAGDTSQ
jgi:predicted signal transduction protein with EAL and GGDEF domain